MTLRTTSLRPTIARAIALGLSLCLALATLVTINASTASATISPDPSPPERPVDPPPGNANFRTFCEFSHAAYDDPIVHPGDSGAAHLHFFFGNTRTDAFSTPESLRSSGSSTCQGTLFNRSAYWMPAVFSGTDTPMLPDRHDVYYKHLTDQPASEVQPLPEGLMMIAGDATGNPADYPSIAYWRCTSWPFDAAHPSTNTIPTCAPGDIVRMTVNFPPCWDGINLDSADHQSHMAYPDYHSDGIAYCPATHPVKVPELSLNFEWEIRDQPSEGWYLSSDRHHNMTMPGGSTLHADWMNGWHMPTQLAWTTSCINEERDCANGSLGDGRTLDALMQLGSGRIPRPIGATGPHCNGRPATIVGTNGDDVIRGTDGDDVIVARDGDDTIYSLGGFDIICSGRGDDTIRSGEGDDEIWSGSGDDIIDAGPGDDFVQASTGNDEIRGRAGNDTLRGGSGNDTIWSGNNENVVVGGPGNDRLIGGWWQDSIIGGPGDDVINGVGGPDRIWGGPGSDDCTQEGRTRSCE